MGNDVYLWEMAKVFEKRPKYVPSMCGKLNKYLRNGFAVFEKRLNYVGKDVDLWEVSKICEKCLKYLTSCLNMWELT